MNEKLCCKNCIFSRTVNSLVPVDKCNNQLSYYFYCINPARKNALVFENGYCCLYQRRMEK